MPELFSDRRESTDPEYLVLKQEYPRIQEAANLFTRSFGRAFTGTPDGHIGTDIAGAAAVAGSAVLKSSGIDLSTMPAGSVLLGEGLNERLDDIFRFVSVAGYQLDVPMKTHSVDVPSQHRPLFDILDLMGKLRTPFETACRSAEVKGVFHPHVGVLTAMKLVKAGDKLKLLDHTVGRTILEQYLLRGAKTIPRQVGR